MSKTLIEIVNGLEHIAEHPKESILKSMKETGKEAIGCFPIYTPEEIVYAAGFLPVGMWGGPTVGNRSGKYLPTFCCSIMKANTEQALLGEYDFLSAIIVTAFCDTLKCITENWKASFPNLAILPIIYPQNRKTEAGKIFLKEEFQRILDEIGKKTGKIASEASLTEAVDIYDEYRRTMQQFADLVSAHPQFFTAKRRHLIIKAAYFMDKKVYTDEIKEILRLAKDLSPEVKKGKRVILTGILGEPTGLLDLLTENELYVVADDLAQETRQFRTISPREWGGLDRMVERIALQDGCSFLYDEEKKRGKMLIDLSKKYDADGIIFIQLKFCDPEEFDWPILKKELEAANIPVLYVETEQQIDSLEQLRTRFQGFSEIL